MIKKVLNLAAKDLRLEFKKKTVIISLMLTTGMLILAPSYQVEILRTRKLEIGMIVMWLILVFNTLTLLNRSLAMEKEADCWDGLRLMPMSPRVILLGKFLFNIILMIINVLIIVPLYLLFYNVSIPSPLMTMAVIIISMAGFIWIGLLFSLLTLNTEGRDVLLPVIVLPIALPIIMVALEISLKTIQGAALGEYWLKFVIMAGYEFFVGLGAFILFSRAMEN